MIVSTRSKSITRATILYAYNKVKKMNGFVPGPKSIGVHGDSYIYAVFKGIGVIKMPLVEGYGMTPSNMISKPETTSEALKQAADQRNDWSDQQKEEYKWLVDWAKWRTER